jgi:hypothetical protein
MGAALILCGGVEFPNEEKRQASALTLRWALFVKYGGSRRAGIIGGDQGIEDTSCEARGLLLPVE